MKEYRRLRRPCTCAAPPVVDLTRAFLQSYQQQQQQQQQQGSESSNHHHHQQQQQQQEQNQQNQQLLENLKSCGWSHVCLDLAALIPSSTTEQITTTTTTSSTSPPTTYSYCHQSSMILQNHGQQDWKELLVHLFEQQQHQHHHHHDGKNTTTTLNNNDNLTGTTLGAAVVYRVAESGSPDTAAGMAEPKQSLEVQRCQCCHFRRHCYSNPSNQHSLEQQQQQQQQQELQVTPPVVMHSNIQQQSLLLHDWTDLFHQVACTVRQVLNFPKNVLLQEEPCHDDDDYYDTTNDDGDGDGDDDYNGHTAQSRRGADHSCPSCSVDLLRAFYYETAATAAACDDHSDFSSAKMTTTATCSPSSSSSSSSSSKRVFGSNEHTDWGSFTIVWQDDVKDCLQTYCHACDSWNNVQVAQSLKMQKQQQQATTNTVNNDNDNNNNNNNSQGINDNNNNNTGHMLYLVVHVGDVTSLAIGQQQQQQQQQNPGLVPPRENQNDTPTATTGECADNNNHIETHGANGRDIDDDDDNTTTTATVIWPSPRHRVCLPTEKQPRRASLVYFAYPPPEHSIDSISQALREWYQQHTTTTTIGVVGGGNASSPQTAMSSTLPQTAPAPAPAPAPAHWVPYQDYYLLQNQGAVAETDKSKNSKDSSINAAQRQFEKIASLPLRTILTEKWNQVQRGGA